MTANGKPHDFDDCLRLSHEAEDLPCWEQVYRAVWPNFQTMVNHRKNGPHQRDGIDRSVLLDNAERILIDEKVRGTNKATGLVYEDVLLEYVSVEERGEPGWVCRPLRAHYIAYAIAPLGICYLLDVPLLQRAWQYLGKTWIEKYRPRRCCSTRNGRVWHTLSVPVPQDVLLAAVQKASILRFAPFDVDESGIVLPPPPPTPPQAEPVRAPPDPVITPPARLKQGDLFTTWRLSP